MEDFREPSRRRALGFGGVLELPAAEIPGIHAKSLYPVDLNKSWY